MEAQEKAMLMDVYTNNVKKESGKGPTGTLEKHIKSLLLRRRCRVSKALVETVLPLLGTEDAWVPESPDLTLPPHLPQHSA